MLCVVFFVWVVSGLVCKTKLAFQELYEAYPNKKWYLRLMDDTLVVAPNLLRMLQRVDPDKSWYEAIPHNVFVFNLMQVSWHPGGTR